MIPPEAAEELPGRIARLARRPAAASRRAPAPVGLLRSSLAGRVRSAARDRVGPAHERRRWGSAADEARPYPASSAGTLPVVRGAAGAVMTGRSSDHLRGRSEGKAVLQPLSPMSPGRSSIDRWRPASSRRGQPLPVVKVSRSPAQRGSTLPAESLAAGSVAANAGRRRLLRSWRSCPRADRDRRVAGPPRRHHPSTPDSSRGVTSPPT